MIPYNQYISTGRVEEIIKTFNYFPTPEMIAQLNQELAPHGKIAANDLELYMKAKSDEFLNGLRELIATKTAESANEAVGQQKGLVEPIYVKDGGQLLLRTPAAKNWPKIGLGKSTAGGKGIFAMKPIKADELIEESPYVQVPMELLQSEPLCDYLFTIDEERCAVVFGYGSLYAHANQPNVRYSVDPVKKCMCYYAKRDISPGEELTVTFGKDWFYTRGMQTK